MKLGKLIRSYRKESKISRRDLALDIGIDHVTLARLENNEVRSITMDNLNKILVWISEPETK